MSSLTMNECSPCSGKIMVLKRTSYLDLRLPLVWVSHRPQRLVVIIAPEKPALNPWAFQWHGKAAIDRLLGFDKVHEGCAAGLILKFYDRGTDLERADQLFCPVYSRTVDMSTYQSSSVPKMLMTKRKTSRFLSVVIFLKSSILNKMRQSLHP